VSSPIEIVPLAPEHRAAVAEFVRRTWHRPDTEAFRRWRYDEPPGLVGWLALREGECLAMECAFRRPYRIGDEDVAILETFDWYSLPSLRNVGLGVRLMQQYMRGGDPVLLVGGSEDALQLLVRLKWRRLGTARRFVRRLSAARVAESAARRLRLPPAAARWLEPPLRPWLRPERRFAPRDGRCLATASVGEEALALYRAPTRYGMFPLWTAESLRWLTAGFPGAGHYIPLYFARGDALVGWSVVRVYESPDGRRAEIVELFAPSADADLYAWMVSEAVCAAAGLAPELVATSSTCPAVAAALARNGFVEIEPLAIHLWWPGRELPAEPHLLGSNTRDTPFNPYPPRWWDGNGVLSARPEGAGDAAG
jgi:hypothetical protein